MAAKDAGLPITTYYSSEVDKYAIQQTKHNFPEVIHLGDVRDVDVSKLEPIDILIGGSPCTQFSFAGKRKGMAVKTFPPYINPTRADYKLFLADENNVYLDYKDYCHNKRLEYEWACVNANKETLEIYTLGRYLELKDEGFEFEGQSYLFWEYMRILKDIQKYNPNVLFLLENVEMTKKWERVLSEAIGIFGVHLNSNLVSAQNRARIYWTNIRVRKEGLFDELYSDIPPPEDRGILLKDVLETEVDEKYYLSDKMVSSLTAISDNHKLKGNGFKFSPIEDQSIKGKCLTGRMHKMGVDDNYICIAMRGRGNDNEQQLEPRNDSKTNTITSVSKDNLVLEQASIKFGRTEEAKATRKENMKNGKDYTPFTQKEIVGLDFDKMNTLTTAINKDNLVMQINPSLESGGKQPYQQNRIYDTEGISPALCANKADLLIQMDKSNTITPDGYLSTGKRNRDEDGKSVLTSMNERRIRRLTVRECSRLQTIPEDYIWVVSDSQAYKQIGNGWTIKMISHIFSFI